MRSGCLTLTALLWSAINGVSGAADLSKLDRTIRKEPEYRTKSPTYCLLVFGADAKTHIWLVHDGDTLYVDRNGNGDLTDPDEKVIKDEVPRDSQHFRLGALVEVDGKTKHQQVIVHFQDENCSLTAQISGRGNQDTRPHEGWLQFASRPADAPVVHFGGPLTLRMAKPLALSGKDRTGELNAELGTRGLGKAHLRQSSISRCPPASIQSPSSSSQTRKWVDRQ